MPQQSSAQRITGLVLTRNEERHISDCLATLTWADEIIVFDSCSSDHTVELAKRCGARVIQHPFQNFAQQRNAALTAAKTGWVFFLDADERCTNHLATEIRSVVETDEHGLWSVPRDNYLFGHLTRGAGYYPDYQARLFRVGQASFDPAREVHELPVYIGTLGYLQQPLIHYNYDNVQQFRVKQYHYIELDAGILYKRGIRPKTRNYVLQPLREFQRRFVTLRGYIDGLHGLRLCVLLAYYNFELYRRLGRLWRQQMR